MDSNKKKGTTFEEEFAEFLSAHGFWVHLLTQNAAGQPADIIAAKNGKTLLIDCKVCEKDLFRLDRIEDNQWTAMSLWRSCGNGDGWFALKTSDGAISLFCLESMERYSLYTTILSRKTINDGEPAEAWVKRWK